MFPTRRSNTITRANLLYLLWHEPMSTEALVDRIAGSPVGKKRTKLVERATRLLDNMQRHEEVSGTSDGWTRGVAAAK